MAAAAAAAAAAPAARAAAEEPAPCDDEIELAAPSAQAARSRRRSSRAPASETYQHVSLVRRQHRTNLVALLRRAMLRADYATAAGAMAVLLVALPEGIERFHTGTRSGAEAALLVQLLWQLLELLRQHAVAPEQLRRAITRTAQLLAKQPGMRQAGQLELILHTWATSSPADALDLIQHEASKTEGSAGSPRSAYTFHLAMLAAAIHHKQWLDQTLAATTGTGRQRTVRRPLLGALQLPWREVRAAPRTGSAWGAGAASQTPAAEPAVGASEAGKELERQLQRALGACPGAALPTLLLCHLLVVSGRPTEAAAVAAAAAPACGRSVEALSLMALLAQPRAVAAVEAATARRQLAAGRAGAADGAGSDDLEAELLGQDDAEEAAGDAAAGAGPASGAAAVHEFTALCGEVLQSDPWALGAMQGLVQASGHCSDCAAAAVRGLLAHLDASQVELAAGECHSCWWPVLATLLVQLASEAVAAAPGAVQALPAAGGAGTAAELQRWLDLRPCLAERQPWWPAAGVADAWELAALQPRQPGGSLLDSAAAAGSAAGSALGPQQQVLVCKALALLFVLGPANAYSAAAAATLSAAAGGADVQARGAARAALADARALAQQLDAAATQDAQRQQSPPQPAAKRQFGARSSQFGALLDMPDAWWAAFPHKRRRARQAAAAAAVAAADAT